MNPDGTPSSAVQNAAETPNHTPNSAVNASPAAPAAAPAPAPSPFDSRGPEGAPHPGEMTFPGVPGGAGPDHGRANEQIQPVSPEQAATGAAPAADPAAAAVQQQAAQLAGVRAALAQFGLAGADQFADDGAALQAVLAQAQAAPVLQQQLQAVLAQQQAYQQHLLRLSQAQQAPAQPAAAAPADPFKAPEWNPAWEPLIQRDEKGQLSLIPGAPPEILSKYHTYQAWRRDFADRLMTDPRGVLQPLVAEAAKQQTEQAVQAALAQQQTTAYIDGFISQNTGWLHSRDGAGQVVRHPQTGQPLLSPMGQRFQNYCNQAEQWGVRDVRQQEAFAKSQLQRDYAMSQAGQQQQAQQAAAALAAANRRPNAGGTIPRPGVPQGVPQNQGLSLRDQLAQSLRDAGISDESLAAGMG